MIIMSFLFSASVFADDSITLHSKIQIGGGEKDMIIKFSKLDGPAEIKIGEKTYAATLKRVVDIYYLESPRGGSDLQVRKILLVQLNGTIINFTHINEIWREDVVADFHPYVIKFRRPDSDLDLPFAGIALDRRKASRSCDKGHPFNAIAVDDDLSPKMDFSSNGLREPCFILKVK